MAVISVAYYANTTSGIGQAQPQTLHTTGTIWIGTTTTTVRGIAQLPKTTIYTTLQPIGMASYPDPIMSATGTNLQCMLSERYSGNSTDTTSCGGGSESTTAALSTGFATTAAVQSANVTGSTSINTVDPSTHVTYTTRTTTTFTTLYPSIQLSKSQPSSEPFSSSIATSSDSTSHTQSSTQSKPNPYSFTLVPWSVPTSQPQTSTPTSLEMSSFTGLGLSSVTCAPSTGAPIDGSSPTLFTSSTTASASLTVNTMTSTSPVGIALTPTPPTANTVVVVSRSLSITALISTAPTVNTVVPLTLTVPATLISSHRVARDKPMKHVEAPRIITTPLQDSPRQDVSSPTVLTYVLLASMLSAILLLLVLRIFKWQSEPDDLPYTSKPPRPGLRKKLSVSVHTRRPSDASATSSKALHVTGNAVNVRRAGGKSSGVGDVAGSRDGEVRRTPSGLLLDV